MSWDVLEAANSRFSVSTVINDYPGFHTGISYAELDSPRAMYFLCRSLGLTQIIYQDGHSQWLDNLAGDLRFWEFVTNWAKNQRRFGPFILVEMPTTPPDQPSSNRVAYLSCDPSYTRGLHRLSSMDRRPGQGGQVEAEVPIPPPSQKKKDRINSLVARAGFLVTSSTCRYNWSPSVYRDFLRAASRGKEELWIRKLSSPVAP